MVRKSNIEETVIKTTAAPCVEIMNGVGAIEPKTIEWNDLSINIKYSISLPDVLSFVADVVDLSFRENGEYIPEITDCIIKINILEKYTDLELPESLEEKYRLIYSTDIMDEVMLHINSAQLRELCESIDRKIKHICSVNASGVQAKLNELVSAYEAMTAQMEQMFSGVSEMDLSKFVSAVAEGGLDEEKLVKAVLAQKKPPKKVKGKSVPKVKR